jgi:ubiquinone/menaquinone biosynthesis C-methylase UbiE
MQEPKPTKATQRAEMPKGTNTVLDNRSVEKDYMSLLPLLKKGLRVLDVGCGTGAITQGIAERVGETGSVMGIDSSAHLIESGQHQWKAVTNLQLIHVDLFQYEPTERFDLIVSARTLQWLEHPQVALEKMKTMLAPNGQLSVLDYNHKGLEWKPKPPKSMVQFYKAFLNWRKDAGMDNEIAKNLPNYFQILGFNNIETLNANEVYKKSDPDFAEKASIWSKVAASRGIQMVEDGYITDEARLQAISEYDAWVENDAMYMVMKLREVRGIFN